MVSHQADGDGRVGDRVVPEAFQTELTSRVADLGAMGMERTLEGTRQREDWGGQCVVKCGETGRLGELHRVGVSSLCQPQGSQAQPRAGGLCVAGSDISKWLSRATSSGRRQLLPHDGGAGPWEGLPPAL